MSDLLDRLRALRDDMRHNASEVATLDEAIEALTPEPGPCPAEAYSWHFYRPEQTDPYWMHCRKFEGHDGQHQSDEGAQWSEPSERESSRE